MERVEERCALNAGVFPFCHPLRTRTSPALPQSGSFNFHNAREAMKSPLAKRLFTIDGVTSVFFGTDFVTVTKSDDYGWQVIKPDVFAAIMDHFSSGEPLFLDDEALAASDTAIHEDDSEVGRSCFCLSGPKKPGVMARHQCGFQMTRRMAARQALPDRQTDRGDTGRTCACDAHRSKETEVASHWPISAKCWVLPMAGGQAMGFADGPAVWPWTAPGSV
jgi:Scaffold protein Nfu/NifU N terminal